MNHSLRKFAAFALPPCHPERSNRFAKRSSYEVEEPALSEAEGTPAPPVVPMLPQGILPNARDSIVRTPWLSSDTASTTGVLRLRWPSLRERQLRSG
jgi:hypothetical protein